MKVNIPYIVFEGEQERQKRIIRKLTVMLGIAVAVLIANNVLWICVWMQR